MAKILAEMPRKRAGAGRKAIYPYDEWLDGQIRQLEGGKDFTSKPSSVLALIRQTAESRGMRLRTRFANDGKDVVIQAYTPEPEPAPEPPKQTVKKSPRRPRGRVQA